MLNYEEIVAAIEEVAPLSGAANWDKSGMQVISSQKMVKTLAVFLDATPANIARALDLGAGFLLSHHPLSLEPVLPNKMDSWRESLRLLLTADVCLYAAHTSLDVNMDGPAGWLGRELKLANKRILEPVGTLERIGFGECGDLPQTETFSSLSARILELLGLEHAHLCGPDPDEKIGRIAYCGGSGGSMTQLAARLGAQLYITGDMRYHAALETPVTTLDVGHYSIEEKMMRFFAALLAKRLPEIEVIFLASESPFRITGSLPH